MLRDDPKIVKDLLKTPRTGVERLVDDPARFFCLILTGMQGRAAVRRVHTGTVGEVAANLQRYFTAIHVDRFDATAPLPQYRLMQSMVLKGELDRLPAELGTELWLAALFATPLSRRLLATVVGRNQAEQKVPPERAALLQLYFALRHRSQHPFSSTPQDPAPENLHATAPQEKAEPMSLDLNYDNKAYLLGRLLAVLESMQTAAQSQGLNRTLVDRFFGAAATRPGTVFPQLLELAIHHKNKASKVSPRKVAALDKMLGAILDGIPAQEGFGRSLDLEGQGRFALGYYQQRQQMIRDAMEAKARREQAKAAGSDTQDSMEEEDPMSTDTGELA
jgi:CRISPR-associated protein Csd1